MWNFSCLIFRRLGSKLQPLLLLSIALPVSVFTFFFVLVCGYNLIVQNHTLQKNDKQLAVQQILASQESELSRRLSYMLSSTYFLAQEVARSNGSFERFDSYSANLLERMDGISNLQLAPDGVISQIYPLAGNEKAIGHDILRDDKRKDEAAQAVRDRMITLAGPFELKQGGIGVIGRNPVFLVQADGSEEFWGFTSALILLEDLIGGAGLSALNPSKYIYELSRIDPTDGKRSVFSGNGNTKGLELHSIDIAVPNGTWTLKVGLANKGESERLLLQLLAAFLVAVLLASIVRRILNEPETLRKKVAKQTRELYRLAYIDGLTGLPNRHQFNKKLAIAIKQNSKSKRGLALLLMDLDHFKEVNDTLGHDNGDILLREAGERILNVLPDNAMLARLGGDEFTVIVTGYGYADVFKKISRDIIETIGKPFVLQGNQVHVSASIGIASASKLNTAPGELLKCADLAMYEVKRRGRGDFIHYNEEIQQKITHRLTLANDLRHAVGAGDLQLLYQPIMESKSAQVNKAEALLRWNHPTHGTISPAVFIPLAEEVGLIHELGDWVFEEAIRQSREWRLTYNKDFQISVNVSPMQFVSENQIPQWIAKINRADVEPNSILIEITEGAFMENNRDNKKLLSTIKSSGIEIALDDFGTGYSSLSYLQDLDLDYLKIDRSFVQYISVESKSYTLCQAILMIANRFGYKVVAEGVETAEQEKLLCDIGCDYLQGFYYSKPIMPREFEQKFFHSLQDEVQLKMVS